jgi:hypothetical protein
MFFQQSKLTKTEWEYCEIPVSTEEKKILHLLKDGYYNLNIKYNDNQTLIQQMKIENTPEIEIYLYVKYFKKQVDEMMSGKNASPHLLSFIATNFTKTKPPKKTDLIRLSNLDANIDNHRKTLFEYILLDFCKDIFDGETTLNIPSITSISQKRTIKNKNPVSYNIYNLIQLKQSHMPGLNKWVLQFVDLVIEEFTSSVDEVAFSTEISPMARMMNDIFAHSPQFIEKNPHVLKYANKTLYNHQKQLFSLFLKRTEDAPSTLLSSKLVFYTAPTGTGKTLSPLGLSNQYRIIYICASRHIGLAFAKNAISIEKKVAFAFGCETASDIRLHYFAAKDYEKNRKSGGIFKVDNSNGEKVEIMICDIASYIIAMYYMLSFNPEKKCIMYWDEPTISLDIPADASAHPLHAIIHDLWKNNSISNIILSCATLPAQHELMDVIEDFSVKFDNAEIHTVSSVECKKTISLINKDKYTVLPHLFFENYGDILECVRNCRNNETILRYFELKEIVRFVEYLEHISRLNDIRQEKGENIPPILSKWLYVSNYFRKIEDMTMNNIKVYYLDVLGAILPEKWNEIYLHLKETHSPYWATEGGGGGVGLKKISSLDERKMSSGGGKEITRMSSLQQPPIKSSVLSLPASNTDGILLTTTDAHTLTDGVSIFFAEDVDKIGKFMIYQSQIPEKVLNHITEKIRVNQQKHTQIDALIKTIDDKIGKDCEKDRKMEKDNFTPEIKKLLNSVEILKNEIKSVSLDSQYIPNTHQHQAIWWKYDDIVPNAFISNITQETVGEVMELDVTTQMKLLLLMGVGVFSNSVNNKYMEIMKKLCFEERLYLIIANSDFIYGMNYQMCHSFFGKDLKNMTQQKIIQAIGRIGRGNVQQEYTIRIRDDDIFRKLFMPQETNIEAENMCQLLSSV